MSEIKGVRTNWKIKKVIFEKKIIFNFSFCIGIVARLKNLALGVLKTLLHHQTEAAYRGALWKMVFFKIS